MAYDGSLTLLSHHSSSNCSSRYAVVMTGWCPFTMLVSASMPNMHSPWSSDSPHCSVHSNAEQYEAEQHTLVHLVVPLVDLIVVRAAVRVVGSNLYPRFCVRHKVRQARHAGNAPAQCVVEPKRGSSALEPEGRPPRAPTTLPEAASARVAAVARRAEGNA